MSGKKVTDSKMEFRREDVPMGIPGFPEFDIWQTDAGLVGNAKRILIDLQEESLKMTGEEFVVDQYVVGS